MRWALLLLVLFISSPATALVEKGMNKFEVGGSSRKDSEGSSYYFSVSEKKFILDQFGVGLNGELWKVGRANWYGFGFSADYYFLFFEEEKACVWRR